MPTSDQANADQSKPNKEGTVNATAHSAPIATVDVALFTLGAGGSLNVLLVTRENEPYAGAQALPGGYVRIDQDANTDETALRVLQSKAHLRNGCFIEQLYTFSGRFRDPRGWSLSVTYYAIAPEDAIEPQSGAIWVSVDHLPDLPFDHNRIIAKAVERLRNKSAYSSLPAYLLPEHFTLEELRHMYETVMQTVLDRMSFRKKMEDQGIVEAVAGSQRRGSAHRPAQLYRLRDQTLREFDRSISRSAS
jgi:8-oxo-dGTP diphosphatase